MPAPFTLPDSVSAIVLTGFMGAGKTTVGRLLADRIGWQFLDLDHEIEHRSGCTVADIFNRHGEVDFRRRETEVLADLLHRTAIVVGLGGGAIETESIRSLIASHPGLVLVYLAAPLEVLLRRCADQPNSAIRPVLADREKLKMRWENRLPHYETAHLCIETENLNPAQTAAQIAELLEAAIPTGHQP